MFQGTEATAANESEQEQEQLIEDEQKDVSNDQQNDENDDDQNDNIGNEDAHGGSKDEAHPGDENDEAGEQENNEGSEEHDPEPEPESENNNAEEPRSAEDLRYNLRSSRLRDCKKHVGPGFRFFAKVHEKHGVRRMISELVRVCFTQTQAKKGIKKHGQRAVAAVLKEYVQLNDLEVMVFLKYDDLTEEQKRKALRAINLIKEKRNGVLKGRTVADGRSQRGYVPKEEASSPALGLDPFIISLLMDAFEGRDVGLFDEPGAYLRVIFPPDKFIVLKFEGEFVDIMVDVNPIYTSEVRKENGKMVLYVQLIRALYGCMESALLWYKLFSEKLQGLGFEINPYEKCVANKTINGKQCTIVWYVDDNKVSHEDPEVVIEIIKQIESYWDGLTAYRGKKLTFLGMDIEFNDDKSVTISTPEYIDEAIEHFGEDVSAKVTSPATKALFEVDTTSPALDRSKQDIFHSVVARLLWIIKRSRPDLETSVSFLCSRVSCSTEEDWSKLKRVLQFVSQTNEDKRTIKADNLNEMSTWIDASYAVHPDMRGHIDGTISFGLGVVHARAGKQKLNVNSSIEAEIVGMSEYLPYNIFINNFMSAQGYDLTKNEIKQDNERAIRMEKNGRNSCTGNSRHVDIRYFFVKDRFDKDELTIEHCPTSEMLADYFTKPLQGALFRKMRSVIMGWEHVNILKADCEACMNKERVENNGSGNPQDVYTRDVIGKKRTYAEAVLDNS